MRWEDFETAEEQKIRDIPSFSKARSDAKNLVALKNAIHVLRGPMKLIGINADQINDALKNADGLMASMEELTTLPDRFNNYFAAHGWIIYEEMSLQTAKDALEKADSGDIEGAEACLAEYYNPETVQQKLRRMKDIEEFRPRMMLAQKALTDYREGRYHACVPVVLALMDGMVNELHLKAKGKRKGLSAEGANLEAWDSVSAHSRGLGQLIPVLMKGRNKTITQRVDMPYRHGIMHGMDLGYDNKIVAAKTWAALFSLRDWAIKVEKGAIDPLSPEKTPGITDLVHLIQRNQEDQQLLREWKPRDVKSGRDISVSGKTESYEEGSPERSLAEFLGYWRDGNYGFMAKKSLASLGSKGPANPRDLNLAYSKRALKAFEFEDIRDQAAAITVITTKLSYEEYGREVERSFEFRLINIDSKGNTQVRGQPDSSWFILNWSWL